MTDAYQDGAYWADLIDHGDEDALMHAEPPDTPTIEAVSRMLGDIRRLQRRVADYERLHMIEVDRLAARRAEIVGPLLRRVAQLEDSCQKFAAAAFRDFGKTTHATPNGVIKVGRALVDELKVDDDKVAVWARPLSPATVTDVPKVVVAELRSLLILYETEAGVFERGIQIAPDEYRALNDPRLPDEWQPEWKGVYFDNSSGGEGGKAITVPDWDADTDRATRLLPGVTWKPTGDQGLGRHITVTAA